MEIAMSQADSAYTTSRLTFPAGPKIRRRQFVTSGVAALAGVITASRTENVSVTGGSDPIFDAIESHRHVFERLRCLFAEQDAAERELKRVPPYGRAELEAKLARLCEAEGLLGRAEMEASRRLASMVPASLKGLVATLNYVRQHYEIGQYPMYEEDGYRQLLFSAERAICIAACLEVPRPGDG
jgi:hypothetical protein